MSKQHQSVTIPTRREILIKIFRKLLSPRDLIRYMEFKFISGNEYPYFDFINVFPWVSPIFNKLYDRKLDIDRPIFIAGLRRSGSTLFYRIMNANNNLFLYNERFPGDTLNGRGIATDNNIYSIANPKDFRNIALKYISPKIRTHYERWGSKLALELAHTHPGSISTQSMYRILSSFPGSLVIGLTRDPRDFVLSALSRGGHDVQWWIDEYIEMMNLFISLQESMTPSFMLVRYEDILENPEEIIQKCCDFTGLCFQQRMLDPENWSIKGPKEYASKSIVSKTQTAKWKLASGNDLKIVEKVSASCFPKAEIFGYKLE